MRKKLHLEDSSDIYKLSVWIRIWKKKGFDKKILDIAREVLIGTLRVRETN